MTANLAHRYLDAKQHVIESGFAHEIDWQDSRRLRATPEPEFLAEAAWVVLSSGMRESVVRAKFPLVSRAFLNWSTAKAIAESAAICATEALQHFNHRPKIDAIVGISTRVAEVGYRKIQDEIQSRGVKFLQTFPFIGPVTSFHLAKNLGMDVVKPDRHLVRLAAAAGYRDPARLCQEIADHVGDRLSVIDVVLWRYATLKTDYRGLFTS